MRGLLRPTSEPPTTPVAAVMIARVTGGRRVDFLSPSATAATATAPMPPANVCVRNSVKREGTRTLACVRTIPCWTGIPTTVARSEGLCHPPLAAFFSPIETTAASFSGFWRFCGLRDRISCSWPSTVSKTSKRSYSSIS